MCDEALVITGVKEGQPAALAGVVPGMRLHAFNGVPCAPAHASWSAVKLLAKDTPKPWTFGFAPAAPLPGPTPAPAPAPAPVAAKVRPTTLSKGSLYRDTSDTSTRRDALPPSTQALGDARSFVVGYTFTEVEAGRAVLPQLSVELAEHEALPLEALLCPGPPGAVTRP